MLRKGQVLYPPFPKDIVIEIETNPCVGELIEIHTERSLSDEREERTQKEKEASRKLFLEGYALERFGVNLDRRRSLEALEAQVKKLEAKE